MSWLVEERSKVTEGLIKVHRCITKAGLCRCRRRILGRGHKYVVIPVAFA